MNTSTMEVTPEITESIKEQLSSAPSLDAGRSFSDAQLAEIVYSLAKSNVCISPVQPLNINIRTFYIVLTQISHKYGLGGRFIPYGSDSNSLDTWKYGPNPLDKYFEGINFNVGSQIINAIWVDA